MPPSKSPRPTGYRTHELLGHNCSLGMGVLRHNHRLQGEEDASLDAVKRSIGGETQQPCSPVAEDEGRWILRIPRCQQPQWHRHWHCLDHSPSSPCAGRPSSTLGWKRPPCSSTSLRPPPQSSASPSFRPRSPFRLMHIWMTVWRIMLIKLP